VNVSETLTARAELRRCADALAASVTSFLVGGTTEKAEAMHTALLAYTDARRAVE
jgi:hypothetical protein